MTTCTTAFWKTTSAGTVPRSHQRQDRGLGRLSGTRLQHEEHPRGSDDDPTSSLLPRLPRPDFLDVVSTRDAHVASRVWPLDGYNTALLNHVHPPNWIDPTGSTSYDLVVIGGGTAGLITAAGSAGVGARVAMIEEVRRVAVRNCLYLSPSLSLSGALEGCSLSAYLSFHLWNLLGGVCLNVGCVPSKTLIHSANLAHAVRGDLECLE
jgi:hypothetical protein